ncbi:RNA polymerase sigma factor [Actinokineospora sp. HUAS TT18]|uniref:RNA polymerase sigma factor n=1 Tax=Actinokineospora sp. HUAS TT18 TaxID=3447451 RepID=UPI003F523EC1
MLTDQVRSLGHRFGCGEAGALEEIHDTFGGRMFGVAYRILGDRDLAADAVQQALLQAWRASGTFDVERPLEPWLFSVTRRAAIDVYRRQRGRENVVSIDSLASDSLPSVEGHSPERAWMAWQVRAAVERLSVSDRAIIKSIYFDDLTQREAAELLGIPIGTVKSRLFRAQRKLTEVLAHLRDSA